jgi:adenylate cyclase
VDVKVAEQPPARGLRPSIKPGIWRRLIGNIAWSRSSRADEEEMARRNPHLMQALEIEKMEGQRIATWSRFAALAVVAVLLVFLNPRWEVIYYEALILLLVVIGIAQLRAARVGKSYAELALLFADMLLVVLILTVPNPLMDEQAPTAMLFRFNGFQYFYVFLAAGLLAYSWRTVQSMGFWIALAWLAAVGGVHFLGTTYPELSAAVAGALPNHERLFAVIDPNSVEFPQRVQEVVILLIVTLILALKSRRASRLLIRQAEIAAERANLSRYLPPSMVDELAHRNEPMGGVRSQEVAVLFADIVGFTRYAESHTPGDVIALLRVFHAGLEEVVFAHGGTLDKYMGDGLMASFGTPISSTHDAANAIAAAFEMQERIAALNAERTMHGLETIRLSVGVHYGPVILGDIGNARRMEFAMLGDTVNVASRLEAATRILDCQILVSQAAMDAVGDLSVRDGFRRRMRLEQGLMLRGRSAGIDAWVV